MSCIAFVPMLSQSDFVLYPVQSVTRESPALRRFRLKPNLAL
jgi:hypothetical protein